MALNPFFQQGSSTEQNLIQDLINEQLKMYGVEVYYLPRQYATENSVIKEVIQSKFENAYPIEAYVDTYDGYNGLGTLMSKFGIQEMDDLTLTISKERFEEYITPLSTGTSNIKLATRPKEGDLIYFPLGDRLFEIKYVEHEKPFYQLQKNYVYQLTCELFRYEDEVIDTDVADIDDNIQDQGYNITLTMVGIASTASALTGVVNGGVRFVTMTNRGNDYTTAPRVAFSRSSGLTATGISTMIEGLVNCYGVTDAKKVQGVEIINPGYGYTVAPGIGFLAGGGAGAAATVGIATTGGVGIVTVTDGGSGYASAPLVTFESPTGPGAAATATVSAAGTVTAVTIDNGGAHYNPSSPPTVTFSDPGDSTGVLFGSWNTHFYISNAGGTVTGSNGSGYSPGTYDLTGGSGTGARLTVTSSSGAITGATSGLSFANGGRNYEVDDVLLIDGGDQNSYIRVAITTTSTNTTATGISSVSSAGIVTSVTITNAGTGYDSAPTVSIANTVGDKVFGSGLVVATGRALISSAGIVTAIRITDAGLGYTTAPTITIGAPSVGSTGTFQYNEIVTGSISSTTAYVNSWDADTNVLELKIVDGTFVAGEFLTGSESGANRAVITVNTDDLVDPYASNDIIETEADAILDFSESNPFGNP